MASLTPSPQRRWGRRAAIVLGVLALPCLASFWGISIYLRQVRELEQSSNTAFRAEARVGGSPQDEARINVLALCDAVQMYRSESGTFLAAGPTPREVPHGNQPVAFPQDDAFEKLGFAPGTAVRFQYQVVVQENPVGEAEVTCYARGDQDADGLNSVYSVTLDANGMTSAVRVEHEDE